LAGVPFGPARYEEAVHAPSVRPVFSWSPLRSAWILTFRPVKRHRCHSFRVLVAGNVLWYRAKRKCSNSVAVAGFRCRWPIQQGKRTGDCTRC